jgi:aspartate/tyrosine/aromatic aminotransferase
MFETLSTAPPDPILGLTEAYNKDPNPDKINLSVGVYQDASGNTPILRCVKQAERRLLDEETSKGYLSIAGMSQFAGQVRDLLFGPEHEIVRSGRSATAQTPGGTGALRVAADFVKQTFPHARIWCSTPTWANHPQVFRFAGLEEKQYAYLNASKNGLDIEGMIRDLEQVPAGDVVCLHACCHNPTGVDPTTEQWERIAQVVHQRRLLPLVDFAYQGFGRGVVEDRQGLLQLCREGCELLVCNSFSKSFGLYSERVGGLTIVADSRSSAEAALSQVKTCIRANYSNPPQHGAAIVATVLADSQLRSLWEEELAQMRNRIWQMRQLFVQTLKQQGIDRDFSFIANQLGMFSFSGLTPLQVDQLRSEYSIYIVGSGRINVAGMTQQNMDRLCTAIKAVL